MQRKSVSGESLIDALCRAVRDSRWMTHLVADLRQRLARVKTKTLRRYCVGFLLVAVLAEYCAVSRVLEHRSLAVRYTAIRPVVTVGDNRAGDGRPSLGGLFKRRWDSLMADPAAKARWDSLVQERPGLADTLKMLEGLDTLVNGK